MKPSLVAWTLLFAAALTAQPLGSVSGRVVSEEDGSPIRGAAVAATQMISLHGIAWTGQDGRYTISNLPPGKYLLHVIKPARGSHDAIGEVRAGEIARLSDIAIPAPSLLAGRVRDQDDLPLEGAVVSLQRPVWRYGRRFLDSPVRTRSDDRGEFRIRIGAPGSFFVALQPPSAPEVAGRYRLLHPPLFYPNAVNPAEAQPAALDLGTKIETVDFQPPAPSGASLVILAKAGQVGEQPRSCARCAFSVLARQTDAWIEVLSGQSNAAGRIEIDGLHPGVYRVTVVEDARGYPYAGYREVIVEKDRTNVQEVVAWSSAPVRVRVTLVDPPEELRDASLSWESGISVSVVEPSYAPVNPNAGQIVQGAGRSGQTRLLLAPGQWALDFDAHDPLPGHAYIQELLVGGRPQRGPFVTVSPEGFAPAIEARIGFSSAKLTGKVSPQPGSSGTWISAEPYPPDGYNRPVGGPVQPDGRFVLEDGVRPGEYVVYAQPAGRSRHIAFADPAVQARYANYAKRVTLAPGETKHVDLETIP